jgi:hypothetical protein
MTANQAPATMEAINKSMQGFPDLDNDSAMIDSWLRDRLRPEKTENAATDLRG